MKNNWILILLLYIPQILLAQHQAEMINAGSSWMYWDSTLVTMPDSANWKTSTSYNTSAWRTGNAPLGYGDPVTTIIRYGGNSGQKNRTAYFRKEVVLDGYLDGGDTIQSHPCAIYKLRVRRDDGIAVYINGRLVFKDNLSLPIGYHTYAAHAADDGATWQEIYIDPHILKLGVNIIAVEVHQDANDSTDLTFDLELKALRTLPFLQKSIIRTTDIWRYLDNNTDPGSTWKNTGFNDSGWSVGTGEFGYGDGDETTTINYGGNPANKYITTYFRKTFTINTLDNFYRLRMRRDDGIALYINGVEVFRDNFKSYETITKTSLASNADDDGNKWIEIILKGSDFIAGQNCIAIEVHQVNISSSDFSFFFELVGLTNTSTLISRGPYLQKPTQTSMTLMWQTNLATIGIVRYGTDPNNLNLSTTPTANTIGHNVTISGLTTDTKYYYSIESNTLVFERTSDNYFKTSPPSNTTQKTRLWSMGCFGSGKFPQRQVQERMLEYVRNNKVDLFLPLGDMAYVEGYDADFQMNYFQPYMYYRTMKQTPTMPIIGNHEYYLGSSNNPNYSNFINTPFNAIFNTFTNAEGGGVASGTERYYSFNYGNIHVVAIDAYGIDGSGLHAYSVGSQQYNWLINDLSNNTQKWTIVITHAPPYSKGKHNSDVEAEMIGMRSLVTVFDTYNVDLVLAAHSHNYERTRLIKGHTGFESSYNPAIHELSSSNGRYDGTSNSCLYNKQTSSKGTVYAVVGSGGRLETQTSTGYPHNAMVYNDFTVQGSYLIEIEGDRMDVAWVSIGNEPYVYDKFTMMKDVNLNAEVINVPSGTPTVNLTSTWIGTYQWSNASTTKTINVPATNGAVYTVTDGSNNCLSKTYTITVSNCPATVTMTAAITLGIVLQEASQTINALNEISSGARVIYDAGHSILLTPGFRANTGSVFKAYIDGCGNIQSRTINPADKEKPNDSKTVKMKESQ